MYRAAPRRKASQLRARQAEQAELALCFCGGHVHRELTRSESFGVDSSSARVVFPITEVIQMSAWLAMNNSTIAAPARVANVVAISFGFSIIINLSLHEEECNMVRHCTCGLYFTRRWLVKYKSPLVQYLTILHSTPCNNICDRAWENQPLYYNFIFRDIGTTLKRAIHW